MHYSSDIFHVFPSYFSPLGGTSSRQKGFLGCMRSLHLNGQNTDLKGRAKLMSGVTSGCLGHCSSYGSNCHNGGKCVEKQSGCSCDCTNSPSEGPFCQKGKMGIHNIAVCGSTWPIQTTWPMILCPEVIHTNATECNDLLPISYDESNNYDIRQFTLFLLCVAV